MHTAVACCGKRLATWGGVVGQVYPRGGRAPALRTQSTARKPEPESLNRLSDPLF